MMKIFKTINNYNKEVYSEALSLHARVRYDLKQKFGMQHKLEYWVEIK